MTVQKTISMLVEDYLTYRRKLGFKLPIEGSLLLQFGKWFDETGYTLPLTTEVALEWAQLPRGTTRRYHARRLIMIRNLARYLFAMDPATEIPPTGLLGSLHHRPPPFIYSPKQIESLLDAAASLRPRDGLRPRTFVTLLGLLSCTGLRISEALRLERADVNLEESLLTIRESKNSKSRLVPLHSTAIPPLTAYADFRDRTIPFPKSKVFFLNIRGHALPYPTVSGTFQKIRRVLAPWPEGSRLPRLYDFRHTFVCRRILNWYENGEDPDQNIFALSSYLGHAKVTDTYWYLTGIPELMAIISSRFERFVEGAGGNL